MLSCTVLNGFPSKTAQRNSNARNKPRNTKVPLIQKPHEKGQWRWLIDVRDLWTRPVGRRMVGYSWLGCIRRFSHTHRKPQSSNCAGVCLCLYSHHKDTNKSFPSSCSLATFWPILYSLCSFFSHPSSVLFLIKQAYLCPFFTFFLSAGSPKRFGRSG